MDIGVDIALLMYLEIFRRFIWGMIRIENESVNNFLQFRSVNEIPPLMDSVEL